MNIEEKFDRVLTSKIREMISSHEPEAYEIGAWEAFEDSALGTRSRSFKFVWVGLAASFLMAMSINNIYTSVNDGTVNYSVSHSSVPSESELASIFENEYRISNNKVQSNAFVNSIESAITPSLDSRKTDEDIIGVVSIGNLYGFSTKLKGEGYMFNAKEHLSSSSTTKSTKSNCILFPAKVGVQVSPALTSINRSGFGWSAGAVTEIPLWKNLSLTAGLLYTHQSAWREHQLKENQEGKGAKVSFSGIELPLNLKYNIFKRKKKEVSVSAGVSSIAYINDNGDEKENSFSNYFPGKADCAKFANVAVAIEFPIEKKVSVLVEPFMKMPIGKSNDQDVKLAMAGVNVRLNYSLAKLN